MNKSIINFRIILTFFGLIIFYSYIHNRAYHILIHDNNFHGMKFTNCDDASSAIQTISLTEAIDSIVNFDKNIKPNNCCSISVHINFRNNFKSFKAIGKYTFLKSENHLQVYFFSFNDMKLWHKETWSNKEGLKEKHLLNTSELSKINHMDQLLENCMLNSNLPELHLNLQICRNGFITSKCQTIN